MCLSEPGVVSDLMSSGSDVDQISITWNQPSIPNGIITVYELRYRKSDSSDSFIYVNGTTNTQHIIDGLLPNTSYTVGVRAYTIAGPGEWTDETIMTSDIRKNLEYCSYKPVCYLFCLHSYGSELSSHLY